MHPYPSTRSWRSLPWLAALFLLLAASVARAADEPDPPGRVAYVSARQGSVVYAPEGEDEWSDLPQNRPLTDGDRLWTDRGARAELQLGTAALHLDSESQLGITKLDDNAGQFILQQGRLGARVRDLDRGENFEIDTPNLALRAVQPGVFLVEVTGQETRISVQSGTADVFGDGGQTVHLSAGQQAAFTGRSLAQAQASGVRQDDFTGWVAERNRAEEQSVTARNVPRGVIGYAALDANGTWGQDATYGAVWYPTVTVADWAPYRYGHWSFIRPWGWTWVDDAPWGFAPFHYGRWAMIGSRWAWVPGRLVARPVYSPALVVFAGGAASFTVRSGPGVAWFPLAPGEVWWPAYRTSPRYVSRVNVYFDLNRYPRTYNNYWWRQHPVAVTAMRQEDFRRGRPVHQNWEHVRADTLGHTRLGFVPGRPEGRRPDAESGARPRLQAAPAPMPAAKAAFLRQANIVPQATTPGRHPDTRSQPPAKREFMQQFPTERPHARQEPAERPHPRQDAADQPHRPRPEAARPHAREDADHPGRALGRRDTPENPPGRALGLREDRPGRALGQQNERPGRGLGRDGEDRPVRARPHAEEAPRPQPPQARAEARQERQERMEQRQERHQRIEQRQERQERQEQRQERAQQHQERAQQHQRPQQGNDERPRRHRGDDDDRRGNR